MEDTMSNIKNATSSEQFAKGTRVRVLVEYRVGLGAQRPNPHSYRYTVLPAGADEPVLPSWSRENYTTGHYYTDGIVENDSVENDFPEGRLDSQMYAMSVRLL